MAFSASFWSWVFSGYIVCAGWWLGGTYSVNPDVDCKHSIMIIWIDTETIIGYYKLTVIGSSGSGGAGGSEGAG